MLAVLIVLIVVLGVLAAELLAVRHLDRRPLAVAGELLEVAPQPSAEWLGSVVAERVTVHLVGDQTIEGLLVDVFPDGVVLRFAELVLDAKHELGGDVFVPRAKVLCVQRHPAAGA